MQATSLRQKDWQNNQSPVHLEKLGRRVQDTELPMQQKEIFIKGQLGVVWFRRKLCRN